MKAIAECKPIIQMQYYLLVPYLVKIKKMMLSKKPSLFYGTDIKAWDTYAQWNRKKGQYNYKSLPHTYKIGSKRSTIYSIIKAGQ